MAPFTLETRDRQCQVMMQSDLTAPVVPALQPALRDELSKGAQEVVFNLERTAVVDSSGIGLLIATCNTIGRQGGRLRVVNVSSDLLQLFQSMRLVTRLGVSGRATA